MTFLPIVQRELRVAARHRLNWSSRLLMAALALVLFYLVHASQNGAANAGLVDFQVLKWLCLFVGSFLGVVITDDTISAEKREGTLGFLFLTDLHGYDIVLGKLLSHSLRAFYAVLAIFPVMSLALLVGGLTGPQFWLGILVICASLMFSLCLGIWVSSFSYEASNATATALILATFSLLIALLSGSKELVQALALLGLAMLMLAAASFGLARNWRRSAFLESNRGKSVRVRSKLSSRSRALLRKKFLGSDPSLWLLLRSAPPGFIIWIGFLLLMIPRSLFYYWEYVVINTRQSSMASLQVAAYLQAACGLCFTLLLIFHCCRILNEPSRNGLLELLLATTVSPGSFFRALCRYAWRVVWVPVASSVAIMAIFVIWQTWIRAPVGSTVIAYGGTVWQIALLGLDLFRTLLAYASICVVGFWMGLGNSKLTLAVIKTFFLTGILPSLLSIGLQLLVFNMLISRLGVLVGLLQRIPAIALNLYLIYWARKRLLTRLRQNSSPEPAERFNDWFLRYRDSFPRFPTGKIPA